MNIIIVILGIVILAASTYLFKKASGTLSISKLNIISYAYYNLLVFTCIGSVIILLGFRNHYMVEKITNDEVIYTTCLFLGYTMIMLPIAIRLFSILFIRGSIQLKYEHFLEKKLDFKSTEGTALTFCTIATFLGTIFTLFMFYNMGGIPLLDALTRNASSSLRISVTHEYAGNSYFRNIFVLMLTPLISYFSYMYMRISKSRKTKWSILFVIDAVLAILIKTYNLEKSPVIYWLFYFYIIEIMIGNQKATKLLKKIAIVSTALIAVMYLFTGYDGKMFSLSSGPLSRIIMTQASTLFLHIQVFPQYHPFLDGASLPTAVSWIFGSSKSWMRSGRIVMQIYNARGVAAGEAGVMNAMFIGEAYANWGVPGVIIAPFVVAIPFVITYGILLRQPKTPLTIVLYIALFATFTSSLQGGFVDFIYNVDFIILILLAIIIQVAVHGGRIRIKNG